MYTSRRIALALPTLLLAIISIPFVFVGAFSFLMVEACSGRVQYHGTTLEPPVAICLCSTYGLLCTLIWSLVTPVSVTLEFLNKGKIAPFDMKDLVTDF